MDTKERQQDNFFFQIFGMSAFLKDVYFQGKISPKSKISKIFYLHTHGLPMRNSSQPLFA